jgi:hypothetical protein
MYKFLDINIIAGENMDVSKQEFSTWLGEEIQNLLLIQDASIRFNESRNLINRVINKYAHASKAERKAALDSLIRSHSTGNIGEFLIKTDNRNEYDYVEAIRATIETILQEE